METRYSSSPGNLLACLGLILLLFCSFSQTVNAAWTPIGIENSVVRAIAIDSVSPGTLYAGADNGIFKSTDNGMSWTKNNAGMDNLYVRALAIDPASPSTIYAGTANGGVYKSTNGATSWDAISNGLNGEDVSSIAINPITSSTIYLGTYDGGVYKSTDGGTNWNAANTGLSNLKVRDLAIDPLTPSTLYAATYGGGIYKSTDSGGNWAAINNGITSLLRMLCIAIDSVNPNTIYLGSYLGGVYKSTDGGNNWNPGNPISTYDEVYDLVIDPETPTTLYAGIRNGASTSGVLKSTDGGNSWVVKNTGMDQNLGYSPNVYALAIDPTTPNTLYAGTDGRGVFKTTDGSDNWNQLNGLPGHANVFTIDPSNPSIIYMGYSQVAYKSVDSGISWNRIFDGYIDHITIDPIEPSTLYISNYKSTDGGSSWVDIMAYSGLVIDPIDHNTIYSSHGAYTIPVYNPVWDEWFEETVPATFIKSIDGGANWITLNSNFYNIESLVIDPVTPTIIYANSGYYDYRTNDGGVTWTLIKGASRGVEIDPVTPSTIYASVYLDEFDISTDRGYSWSYDTADSVPLYDPFVATTQYKSASDGSILKSTDNGSSWAVFSGKPDSPQVRLVAIAPTTPLTFYGMPLRTAIYSLGDAYSDSVYKYTLGSTPDKFMFSDLTDAPLGTLTTSSTLNITGIDVSLIISVTGGEYSLNGGSFTSITSTVSNGDTLQLRTNSSSEHNTKVDVIVMVGGVSATFGVTTLVAGNTPNAFTFTDQADVAINTSIISGGVTIDGMNTAMPISVINGEYSIDGGTYTANGGLVNNGSTVSVQTTSSSSFSTVTDVTLTIGGISDTFTVTTEDDTDGDGTGNTSDTNDDNDGHEDTVDNCTLSANNTQLDTDGDGYGNACDSDFNNDNIVNSLDIDPFRVTFFTTGSQQTDLNGDSIVNSLDLGLFKRQFMKVPGPSGLNP